MTFLVLSYFIYFLMLVTLSLLICRTFMCKVKKNDIIISHIPVILHIYGALRFSYIAHRNFASSSRVVVHQRRTDFSQRSQYPSHRQRPLFPYNYSISSRTSSHGERHIELNRWEKTVDIGNAIGAKRWRDSKMQRLVRRYRGNEWE